MQTQIITPPAFQRPSGKLYLGTAQLDLSSAVPTLVELDTVPAEYKNGIENIVTHRIVPGRAGFYSISAQVSFNQVVADKHYGADLRISGVTKSLNYNHASLAIRIAAICSLPCQYITANDYIELFAVSFADVDTVDLFGEEKMTYLMVQRVR